MQETAIRWLAGLQAFAPRTSDDDGQTVIEYALVVALVSVVVAVLLAGFGTEIVTWARGKVGNGFT